MNRTRNYPMTFFDLYHRIKELFPLSTPTPGNEAHPDYLLFDSALLGEYLRSPLNTYAFFQIFDERKTEIIWQYGMESALGMSTKECLWYAHLQRINPDFRDMYSFWAQLNNELDDTKLQNALTAEMCYHIRVPFLCADGNYHWYTQHTIALATDNAGHHLTNFNYFEYGGAFNVHNASTQPPFITTRSFTITADGTKALHQAAGKRLMDMLTPREQYLAKWYANGSQGESALRIGRNTIHEYNANILRKLKRYLVIDFASAKAACIFLKETGFW